MGKPTPPPNTTSETSSLTDGLNIIVSKYKDHGGYHLMLDNINTEGKMYEVILDLAGCTNVKLEARGEASLKDKKIHAAVGPGMTMEIVNLPTINKFASSGLSYDAKIKSKVEPAQVSAAKKLQAADNVSIPSGCTDFERHQLTEDMDMLVFNKSEGGYHLQIENKHLSRSYLVTVKLDGCSNLIYVPAGDAEFDGSSQSVLKVTVPPKSNAPVADLPLRDRKSGSACLQYSCVMSRVVE